MSVELAEDLDKVGARVVYALSKVDCLQYLVLHEQVLQHFRFEGGDQTISYLQAGNLASWEEHRLEQIKEAHGMVEVHFVYVYIGQAR